MLTKDVVKFGAFVVTNQVCRPTLHARRTPAALPLSIGLMT